MNAFGLCFSFLLPGMLIGFLGGWAMAQEYYRELMRRSRRK